MKKLLLMFIATFLMFGCSKDDKNDQEPDSPYKSSILGTWELTHFDGVSVSLMPEIFNKTTTISFGSNNSYSGKGVFGNGSGTYKLSGNVATTFIDGQEFNKYEILSLKDNVVEAKMSDKAGYSTIKAKKVK